MKNFLEKIFNWLDSSIQKKNIEILKKYLGKKINIYIDVGAHKGEMIKILRKNFKINKIFAFEPNPECLKFLKKKYIVLFPLALSNINGKRKFKIGHLSSMSTLNKINEKAIYSKLKRLIIKIFYKENDIYKKNLNIKTKRFEDINFLKKHEYVDFLKIDTEGHEFNVIRGFGKHILKVKFILFEYHYDKSLIKNYEFNEINTYLLFKNFKLVSKNKMLFRKGYELIYKNIKYE